MVAGLAIYELCSAQYLMRDKHNNRMHYQGKITYWKDGQGYGFIAPNDGGKQVFIHIKSFLSRQRRSASSEIVTYEHQDRC